MNHLVKQLLLVCKLVKFPKYPSVCLFTFFFFFFIFPYLFYICLFSLHVLHPSTEAYLLHPNRRADEAAGATAAAATAVWYGSDSARLRVEPPLPHRCSTRPSSTSSLRPAPVLLLAVLLIPARPGKRVWAHSLSDEARVSHYFGLYLTLLACLTMFPGASCVKCFHFHPFGRADVEPSRMSIWSWSGRRSRLPCDGIYVHPIYDVLLLFRCKRCLLFLLYKYNLPNYTIFSHHRRIKFHYRKAKKLQKFNDPKSRLQELVDGYSRHPSTVKLLATLPV